MIWNAYETHMKRILQDSIERWPLFRLLQLPFGWLTLRACPAEQLPGVPGVPEMTTPVATGKPLKDNTNAG